MGFLKSIYPFNQLDAFDLEEAYKRIRPVQFNQGDTIKAYDEVSNSLYLIHSGTASVVVRVDGNEETIEEYGPNEMICEYALDSKVLYSAKVLANS